MKEMDLTGDKVRPEYADLLRLVPADVPVPLQDTVADAFLGANKIQHFVNGVMDSPLSHEIAGGTLQKAIEQASLLSPASPMSGITYTFLTHVITQDSFSPAAKMTATVLGDALTHQAQLPVTEKLAYPHAGGIQQKQRFQDAAAFLAEQPTTEASQKALDDMVQAKGDYLSDMVEGVIIPPESEEDQLRRLKVVDNLVSLQQMGFYQAAATMSSADMQEVLKWIVMTEQYHLSTNRFSVPLLTNGKLDESSAFMQYSVWSIGMTHFSRLNTPEGNMNAKKLGKYFFVNAETQSTYWSSLQNISERVVPMEAFSNDDTKQTALKKVPIVYTQTDWFFKQDAKAIASYFDTFPREEDVKESAENVKRLTGLVAIFQTLNPDHPNIPVLRRQLTEVAKEQRVAKRVSTTLDIVTDTVPGVITLSKHGIAATRLMPDQRLDDILPPDASLLYQSKAEYPKINVEKPNSEPPATVDVAQREDILVIASGNEISVPHWHEVQRPRTEDVPQILNHLSERLSRREPDEEALLELALQEIPRTPLHEQVVLLPSLLEANHELTVLGAVGIVGVQRDVDKLSFILDARRSGIATEGSPFLVLKGEKHADNEVQLSDAPDEFDGSLLQLGLTGAALATYSESVQQGKVGKKVADRLGQIPGVVAEWNRDNRVNGYPHVSNVSPSPAETAVAFPITKTEVVHLTLQDAVVK